MFLFPVAQVSHRWGCEQIGGDSECFSVFPPTDLSPESDGGEEGIKKG